MSPIQTMNMAGQIHKPCPLHALGNLTQLLTTIERVHIYCGQVVGLFWGYLLAICWDCERGFLVYFPKQSATSQTCPINTLVTIVLKLRSTDYPLILLTSRIYHVHCQLKTKLNNHNCCGFNYAYCYCLNLVNSTKTYVDSMC